MSGIKSRVRKGRGMTEGLLYVEAYLPFDPVAFTEFVKKWQELGSAEAVEAAYPELAKKALVPIDTDGEAMLQDHVIKLAHAFMEQSQKMDVQHDGWERDSMQVVQSFVNTPEIASPNWWPGAWVTVIKVQKGTPEWDLFESGDLNAVSFQGDVIKTPVTANID